VNFLARIKQLFDEAFPGWPERWAAYVIAALGLGLLLGAIRAC